MTGELRTGWRRVAAVALGCLPALLCAGVALAAGGGEHGEHGGISPEKITDITWRSVNFLVFAGLLVYLMVKKVRVKDFFGARTQEIAQTLEEMEAKKAATAQALKEAEARLAAVSKEHEAIIKQYLAEGEAEKAKILDKANQVAERIKEMAALSIQQETKKAAQSLKEEVVDLATKMATDLIKEKATYADQQGLVEEYLKKVVTTH